MSIAYCILINFIDLRSEATLYTRLDILTVQHLHRYIEGSDDDPDGIGYVFVFYYHSY